VNSRVERLRSWLRPALRELSPYAPEPAGPAIRLDANESPEDLPAEWKQELWQELARVPWNRYPDPQALELRQALAEWEDVRPEQVLPGNGSDELLRDLLTVYGGPGTQTVFPTPTFAMYRQLTVALGGTPVGVPLRADWSLDLAAMLAAVRSTATRLVFLASPNNPTGNTFPAAQIEEVLRGAEGLVVVDEAYRFFSGESFTSRLADYPQLVILNTFSKSMSLAGVRLGYLLADPEIIAALERVRLPYNLDALAQVIARRVLARPEYWRAQAEKIKAERDGLAQELSKLRGVQVFPSRANFLLVRAPGAAAWKQALAEGGVAVRGFSAREGLENCLRITVGRPEENQRLLELSREYFAR
jgi:histidinol-phosphate aminotransferase